MCRNYGLQDCLNLCVLLAIGAFFYCFHLDLPSIANKDEYLHVRAAQDMWQQHHYIVPWVDGVPYLHKPPFKMWVTQLFLATFGESMFSYRLPDAVAGLMLLALLYWFSVAILKSRTAGIFSCIGFLGCHSVLFVHGFRSANQDALLLLLLTATLMLGYVALTKLNDSLWPFLGIGILIACATLTKSVASLIAPAILFAFFCGERLLHNAGTIRLFPILAMLGVALLLPLGYFYSLDHFTHEAYRTLLEYELVNRFKDGFHNADRPFFYFEMLFRSGEILTPEIVGFALLTGVFLSIQSANSTARFLMLWAVLPPLLYSALPSRLLWYINPAVPAIALLFGLGVTLCLQQMVQLRTPVWQKIMLGLFGSFMTFRLFTAIAHNLEEIVHMPKPIPFDSFDRALRTSETRYQDIQLISLESLKLQKHERVYASMEHIHQRHYRWLSRHVQELRESPVLVLVQDTPENALKLVQELSPVSSYVIEPYSVRKTPIIVFSFNPSMDIAVFQPI